MSGKVLLVLNRKSAARPDVREIVRSLEKDLRLRVVVPWTRKDLAREVRRAAGKGWTRIVAGGGDGTLNKVANAVLAQKSPGTLSMGLVPLGTANDFARAYGDRGEDLALSIRVAATGAASPIDVGRVNGRIFVNVASGGFGAMITATTPQDVKRRLGGLAYTLNGLARLSELEPVPGRLAVDGDRPRELAIAALAIGNSRFAGGGFDVAPEADLADGLLDLGVISVDGLAGSRDRIRQMVDPDDPTKGIVDRWQFRKAMLETERPFHINLDGEPMVERRFDISVEPGALNFVLPEA